MNKINLYLEPIFSLDEIITQEIDLFHSNLKNKVNDYFNFTDTQNTADLHLIHILEISQCYSISTEKDIILFFHFKPNLDEISIINKIINNLNILLIISHFNVEGWKNHYQVTWPLTSNLKLEFIEKKNCEIVSPDIFNFTFIHLIHKNIQPILTEKWDLSVKYDTVIKEKRVPKKINYIFFLENLNYLIQKQNQFILSKEKYIFLPLLNIIDYDKSYPTLNKCRELCDDSKDMDLCFDTEKKIKKFYPWGLTLSFESLDKGLFVNKKTINTFSLKTPQLAGYHNIFFLEMDNYYLNDNKKLRGFIKDSYGNDYKGIPSFLDLNFTDKTLYIKKPKITNKIKKGIIVYIDNIEHLENLKLLIKKIENTCNLELNYEVELENEISKIGNHKFIKKNPIDLSDFKDSNHLILELKLYLLLISNFEKCLFLDLNIVFWGNFNSIFDKLDTNDIIFFKTLTNPPQIRNLFTDMNSELYLDEYDNIEPIETGLFVIDIIKCWIPILMTLGFISKYSKDILSNKSIELLYLALLIQKKKFLL